MKKLAYGVLLVLALLAAAIQLGGYGYFWKALASTYFQGHSTAHIDDAHNFAQRNIATGTPQAWPKDARYNQKALDPAMASYLQQHGTAGFLVAQKGALVHEQYFGAYSAQSRTNSFSMAKTITTMQVQMAVQQGAISSFDAPFTERLPEYAQDPRGQKATISQLSSMKSGHDWTENYYLPLNITTDLYYGKNAEKLVLGQGFERDPGTEYEYSSGSTQLLGVFLKRALQAK
jgi:CubicO group peptidase (beta-lactamase class C family)